MITSKWFIGSQGIDDAHYIRRKVFIEEQGVSEEVELDGTDEFAMHVVLYYMEKPVATGRVLKMSDAKDEIVVGRVAVLKEYRGKHLGDLAVRLLIRRAFDAGFTKQVIHSQLSAKSFYEKLGFVAVGGEYEEAGIPHINMERSGDILGDCCKENK